MKSLNVLRVVWMLLALALLAPWALPADAQLVAGGYVHTCALKPGGIAACWGDNSSGQATVPPDAAPMKALAAGASHTCALRSNGSVRCWGATVAGEDFGQAASPVGTFSAIVAGMYHSCALRTDGTAQCWGAGAVSGTAGLAPPWNYGQSNPPADTFTALAAGAFHTCGLHADGSVLCWGNNAAGQLTPPGSVQFTALTAGLYHTCGLTTDGSARCWGSNIYGEAVVPQPAPPAVLTFTAIAAGETSTCGLRPDGSVVCWGAGPTYNTTDTPYDFGQMIPPTGAAPFTALATGSTHTCGLHADHSLQCWGAGTGVSAFPQLGQSMVPPGIYGSGIVVVTSSGTTVFQQAASGASTPVPVDPGLQLSAIAPNAATVAIDTNLRNREDVLDFTNTSAPTFGDISATYDAGTGVLSLSSSSATSAQWQAALRAVTYVNLRQVPVAADTATRTLSFVVRDSSTVSAPATKSLSVTKAPAPGALSNVTLTVTTNSAAVVSDGQCSLPEAVGVINDGYVYADCPRSASTGDLIVFAPSLPANIVYIGAGDRMALKAPMTIDGSAVAGLRIDGDGDPTANSSLFEVAYTVSVTIQHLAVANGNSGSSEAGAINNNGNLTLSDVHLYGNRNAKGGGAILNLRALTILDSLVEGNSTSGNSPGGAIHSWNPMTIQRSRFLNNQAGSFGGALAVEGGAVRITDSSFDGNSAATYAGGGIFVGNATLNLAGSTLTNNTTTGNGGAIGNFGNLSVLNSTFSGNTATGSGGAIRNTNAANVVNATFTGNSAGSGSSLANTSGALLLKNSIVQQASGVGCAGTLTDGTGNLRWPASDASCVGMVGDPQLGALANNGGATLTLLPGPASAAINAVTDCTDAAGAAIVTDQRGVSRPQGGACDSGAVEVVPDRIFADGFDGS